MTLDNQQLLETIVQLIRPAAKDTPVKATRVIEDGYQILVLDRGFVFVGCAEQHGDFVKLYDAKCIRYWGTTRGLGELASGGPTSKTKLDDAWTLTIPNASIIVSYLTEASRWKS